MAFNIRNYLGITGTSPAIPHNQSTNPIPDALLNDIDAKINELIGLLAGAKPPRKDPTTAAEVEQCLKDIIKDNGLEDFYKPDDPRIKAIAENAEKVMKAGTAPLCKPEHIPTIVNICLYDVVLYLDDSYSMTLSPERIPTQAKFVRRLCEILFPFQSDTKAAVRFINDNGTWDNLTTPEAVEAAAKSAAYTGYTPIGTQLKAKILQPMVYNKLDNGTFATPVLVIVITDGWPYTEADDVFRQNIAECRQKLKAAKKSRTGVMYNVNQIGTAPEAEAFINTLYQDKAIKKNLYITSEKLDDKIAEFKENDEKLSEWMHDLLFNTAEQAKEAAKATD